MGATDENLADELARALLVPPIGQWPKPEYLNQAPHGIGAFTSPADYEARLNTVPGWDAIIHVGPYGDCKRAARDPAITNWWLRRRLQHTEGFAEDSIHSVLAVRDGAIVAEVLAYSGLGIWASDGTVKLKDVVLRRP